MDRVKPAPTLDKILPGHDEPDELPILREPLPGPSWANAVRAFLPWNWRALFEEKK